MDEYRELQGAAERCPHCRSFETLMPHSGLASRGTDHIEMMRPDPYGGPQVPTVWLDVGGQYL